MYVASMIINSFMYVASMIINSFMYVASMIINNYILLIIASSFTHINDIIVLTFRAATRDVPTIFPSLSNTSIPSFSSCFLIRNEFREDAAAIGSRVHVLYQECSQKIVCGC